jgi:hypothetical protein
MSLNSELRGIILRRSASTQVQSCQGDRPRALSATQQKGTYVAKNAFRDKNASRQDPPRSDAAHRARRTTRNTKGDKKKSWRRCRPSRLTPLPRLPIRGSLLETRRGSTPLSFFCNHPDQFARNGSWPTSPMAKLANLANSADCRARDKKRCQSRAAQLRRLAHLVISNISADPSSRSRLWLGARRRSIVPAASPLSCNSCLSWFHLLPILPSFGFRAFTTPSPLTTRPPRPINSQNQAPTHVPFHADLDK